MSTGDGSEQRSSGGSATCQVCKHELAAKFCAACEPRGHSRMCYVCEVTTHQRLEGEHNVDENNMHNC